MQFRYYIVEIYDGTVYGTNDKEQAESFAQDQESFVIDSEKGLWMLDTKNEEIGEIPA